MLLFVCMCTLKFCAYDMFLICSNLIYYSTPNSQHLTGRKLCCILTHGPRFV